MSLLGCYTLKEQYQHRSLEIQEYCKSVFKDAGYKKTIPKKIMSECISQTEDREQIRLQLWGIRLQIFAVGLVLGLLL